MRNFAFEQDLQADPLKSKAAGAALYKTKTT